MQKFLRMLEKDSKAISLGRLCALGAFAVFVIVSLYLALAVKTWGNYDTFAWVCLAFILVQLGNKAIETRAFKITALGQNREEHNSAR